MFVLMKEQRASILIRRRVGKISLRITELDMGYLAK